MNVKSGGCLGVNPPNDTCAIWCDHYMTYTHIVSYISIFAVKVKCIHTSSHFSAAIVKRNIWKHSKHVDVVVQSHTDLQKKYCVLHTCAWRHTHTPFTPKCVNIVQNRPPSSIPLLWITLSILDLSSISHCPLFSLQQSCLLLCPFQSPPFFFKQLPPIFSCFLIFQP